MSTEPGMGAAPPLGAAQYATPKTSGMAIASFVLGICSFICSIFTGLPAIILGIIALTKINGSRGQLKGGGFAIAGISLGAIASLIIFPIALLLPAIQAAREAARRSQSNNNIKQISLAMFNYENIHRAFPARGGGGDGKGTQLSWRVHILPYLEEAALYDRFHLDEPWDSEHNRELIQYMPQVFENPNKNLPPGKTSYLLVKGPGTAFPDPDSRPTTRDFRDGLSNTIMIVEADADQAVEWTKPDDWQFDPNDPTKGLGHLRPGGFIAGMADGSVKFVGQDTDAITIKELMTNSDEVPAEMP